ncbi:MAG: putative aminohydrolase SsnA [Anaerolineae bacterium]|nr:putative aminohydrolase SsnA [Anaerolineae bacterium]
MLIDNATLVTWGSDLRLLHDHALLLQDGRIAAMGPSMALRRRYPEAPVLDADGQLVLPGNICAHTHFYGALARGMAIPGPPPADFPQILQRLWWPLDRALDADSIRLSALVSLVDAIKHGTTTLIDHHASANCIEGSLDIIADAVEQAGLRAVLCYEVTDRDGPERAAAGIAENLRLLQAAGGRERVAATFGLHAGLTLGDETLRRCADQLPQGVGVHVHVAEHEADQLDSLQRSGLRVVPRLDRFGLWRPGSIAAHCVHTDAAEREMLQERGVWISHQPRSNMNNGVGAAALDAMLAAGMPVCLGNDGMGNNMWAEWKAAYLLHKVTGRDPRRAPGDAIARMAALNNAALARHFFPGSQVGELTPGAVADLIFVDYRPFTPLHAGNLPWHILFGFEASMVTTTIVQGQILMKERQLLTLDERAIAAAACELVPALWQRQAAFARAAH